MEDVLDLYAEEPDRKRPVVCFDESPTHPHKMMFTTEKARDKMGRAYPKLLTKESKSL